MEQHIDQFSLVIVGNWNPAILQPPWILHNVFGLPEKEIRQVVVEFPMPPTVQSSPRYIVEGIRFISDFGKLTLNPKGPSESDINQIENIIFIKHSVVNIVIAVY